MKKSRIFSLILVIVLLLNAITLPGSAIEYDFSAVTNGSRSLDAAVPYLGTGELVENTEAAILYEMNTDSLMYVWNPDVRVSPSSLVKILTTLIAVEKGNLETVVTVEEDVLSTVPDDAVVADLLPGEQMSLSDLLYCMMVGSANDAAAVIADHVCGSQESFVAEMNRYAQELGCKDTKFTNVHGLHDENQYTTVRDLGRILAAAINNEKFMVYFSAVRYLVPATNLSEERSLACSNFLMNNDSMEIYYDSRVTGGRTGVTNDGNRCLAASAESNGLSMICIVMGCKSTFAEDGNTITYGSFKETSMLFDAAFNGYKAVRVLCEGQSLRQMTVLNGNCDLVIGPHDSVLTILPSDINTTDLSYQYMLYQEEVKAPVKAGDRIAQVQIWYNNVCVAQTDLYAMHDVSVAVAISDTANATNGSFWTRFTGIFAVLLVVAVAAIVFMRYGGSIKAFLLQRRTRRYRQNRRRSR